MNQDLQWLAALADLDDQVTREQRRLAKAQGAVPKAEVAVARASEVLAAAEEALAVHADAEHRLQREVEQYRKRLKSALNTLETGAGDAAAAERQRAQCEEILDARETSMLESLETRDAREETVLVAKAALAARVSEVGDAATASAPEVVAAQAALAALGDQRAGVRVNINATELLRYDGLKERGKRPVALVVDRACKSCHTVVVASSLHEIRRGRLQTCRCGRWLYLPAPS